MLSLGASKQSFFTTGSKATRGTLDAGLVCGLLGLLGRRWRCGPVHLSRFQRRGFLHSGLGHFAGRRTPSQSPFRPLESHSYPHWPHLQTVRETSTNYLSGQGH